MKKVNIKSDFADDWISRKAGENLRCLIIEAAGNNEKIEIDFAGLLIASTSFFDEGFAKLAKSGWTREKLSSQITFKNLHPKDKMILEEMCRNRGMQEK